MKSFLTAVLALCAAVIAVAAPSKEDVLAAVAMLEGNPISEAAGNAAKTVVEFARESNLVIIALGPETAPWITQKEPSVDASVPRMLLAAYLAGNIKSQIEHGSPRDDPYAGWLLTIDVYRKFQAKRSFTISTVERLAEMESKGELKEHAQKILTQISRDDGSPASKTGAIASSRLLKISRLQSTMEGTAPDGLRMLFLVTKNPGSTGNFTLQETTDFLIAGKSYVERTHEELGRKFEPQTVVDSADKFFAKNPDLRPQNSAAVEDGSMILSISILGAPLKTGLDASVAIKVGFDKKAESFVFPFEIPAP